MSVTHGSTGGVSLTTWVIVGYEAGFFKGRTGRGSLQRDKGPWSLLWLVSLKASPTLGDTQGQWLPLPLTGGALPMRALAQAPPGNDFREKGIAWRRDHCKHWVNQTAVFWVWAMLHHRMGPDMFYAVVNQDPGPKG